MPLWIRVEADTADSPKVHKFAKRIGLPVPATVGHLVMLWGKVAAHRTDGNLKGVLSESLERWAGWTGQPGKFAKAFRKTFIKNGGILHGWGERQGKLIMHQIADRLRKTPTPAKESPRNVHGSSTENPRLRNATNTKSLIRKGEHGERQPRRISDVDIAYALKERLNQKRLNQNRGQQ